MWYPVDETGECLRIAVFRDAPYEELSCLYPTYGKTYFSWETITDFHVRIWDAMVANPWLPFAVCAFYGLSIVLGQQYFASRPALDWRRGMAVWNLGLAAFSFWGFMRTAPQLAHNLYYYGWQTSLMEDPLSLFGTGSTVHWVMWFILSKFVELFDTFFIVIHKKKLMFLHWYHHITVLLFCWHSWINQQPMGLIFCVVNYAVHSVMYFYYFLMATKCKPKWFNPQVITVAQISQMVVGVTACTQAWALADLPGSFINKNVIKAGFAMYASYLALFVQFFIDRYVVRAKNSSQNKTA